jgi:hypothetical protein
VNWSGKTKTRKFILEDFFIGAGMEQNWPDAWEQGKRNKGKKGRTNAVEDSRATTGRK